MLSSRQVIDTYFLEARHMLLEIAALLDRHDAARAREAAGGETAAAPAPANLLLLREAVAVLSADPSGRERTVELLELFARS